MKVLWYGFSKIPALSQEEDHFLCVAMNMYLSQKYRPAHLELWTVIAAHRGIAGWLFGCFEFLQQSYHGVQVLELTKRVRILKWCLGLCFWQLASRILV